MWDSLQFERYLAIGNQYPNLTHVFISDDAIMTPTLMHVMEVGLYLQVRPDQLKGLRHGGLVCKGRHSDHQIHHGQPGGGVVLQRTVSGLSLSLQSQPINSRNCTL